MSDTSLGTPEQLRDPNYTPPLGKAVPLGIQHVLAMFVSNFTPAIIVAGAVGFAFGSEDRTFLIQMSMLFAGIATLIQTIGLGPVGARLPVVQGTSFAYVPIMIPIAKGFGMGALLTSVVAGGIFHLLLGTVIKRIRHWLPPLVTGLIVLMIGLYLIKVGIEYAAGGAGDFNRGKETWGGGANWFVAFVVIAVALLFKFYAKGIWSLASVLIGLVVGYIVAAMFGMVSFSGIAAASWVPSISLMPYGFEWNWGAVIAMCLISIVSAIETVGDTSGIAKGGANREATDNEIAGATYADGLGTAVAGVFGGLPNTSFSQNVGLVSMTGVMSRHVVTIGAIFLILCGLIPKVGALIASMPLPVLGGGVVVMFGMVAAAGVRMLSEVRWGQRNMLIFAVALSVGLGLQLVPDAFQFLDQGGVLKILLTSGLLPAAFIAILLNLLLPDDDTDGDYETQISGLGNVEGDGTIHGVGEIGNRAAAHAGQATSAAALVGGSAALAAGGAVASAKSAGGAAASRTTAATAKTGTAVRKTTARAKTATKRAGSSVSAKAKSASKPAARKATAKPATKKAKAKPAARKAATKPAARKTAAKKPGTAAKRTTSSTTKAASSARRSAASKSRATASKAKTARKSTAKPTSRTASKARKPAAAKARPARKSAAKTTRKAVTRTTKATTRVAPKTTRKAASKSASTRAKTAKRSLVGSALDDLEFVDGIGPKTAGSLKRAGVRNLSGLVAMSATALESAAERAGTGGRPKPENWKGQARNILAGKPPRAKSDRAAWERAKKKL